MKIGVVLSWGSDGDGYKYNTNAIASFTSTAVNRNPAAVDRNKRGYGGVCPLAGAGAHTPKL